MISTGKSNLDKILLKFYRDRYRRSLRELKFLNVPFSGDGQLTPNSPFSI